MQTYFLIEVIIRTLSLANLLRKPVKEKLPSLKIIFIQTKKVSRTMKNKSLPHGKKQRSTKVLKAMISISTNFEAECR